ncbi:hypothetical protein C8R45DRAFT_1207573 [Mycena sanguinolenta]|nr:hypothetical protein C8R45DRAFT_1207573 [Mycena sanguinolenta]
MNTSEWCAEHGSSATGIMPPRFQHARVPHHRRALPYLPYCSPSAQNRERVPHEVEIDAAIAAWTRLQVEARARVPVGLVASARDHTRGQVRSLAFAGRSRRDAAPPLCLTEVTVDGTPQCGALPQLDVCDPKPHWAETAGDEVAGDGCARWTSLFCGGPSMPPLSAACLHCGEYPVVVVFLRSLVFSCLSSSRDAFFGPRTDRLRRTGKTPPPAVLFPNPWHLRRSASLYNRLTERHGADGDPFRP